MTANDVLTAKLRSALTAVGRVLLTVSLLIATTAGTSAAAPRAVDGSVRQTSAKATSAHTLIQNVGQFAPGAEFLLKQGDRRIWLTDDALWLTEPDPALASPMKVKGPHQAQAASRGSGTAIRFTFAGANPHATLEPFGRVPTHVSYLIGNDPTAWHSDVPVWSGVRYHDLYPGIDLVIGDGSSGNVPWRLEARQGADPKAVVLRAEGADAATAEAGLLQLGMRGRVVDIALPTWSIADVADPLLSAVVQTPEEGGFALLPDFSAQLTPSAAAGAPAAADAGDLIFGASLGGSLDDTGYAIAVDSDGNSYITGLTRSTDLPVTPGAYDPTNAGTDEPTDAFAAKLNAAGDSFIYVTYLGGTGLDAGFGIGVTADLAYVAGKTNSPDFAGTTGSGDDTDAFVAALNATGTNVRYATRLGGSEDDTASGIALEGMDAYVVGRTSSSDLPGATNCASDTGTNVVVAKLNMSGAPVYTTCLAGALNESGAAIAVRSGVAYVTGDSQELDYSTSDMLVATFAANGIASGTRLMGGTDYDWGSGIAVDPAGNLYIAGASYSTDFPVTPGTRPFGGGPDDAVVVKLLPALTTDFATYVGGNGDDEATGIAIDTVQALYIVGTTDSTDFPVTLGAYDTGFNGETDLFVMRMHLSSIDPAKRTYSTYLGGPYADYGLGITTDTDGHAFVTGIRGLGNEHELSDALVAKLKPRSLFVVFLAYLAGSGTNALLTWDAVPSTANHHVFRSDAP